LGFVGVLMISTMRTLSLKAVRIPRSLSRVVLVLTLLVVGLVFFRPWLLLVSVNVIYIFILLVSIVKARGNLFAQS
ncbi:MAG: CDP-diacylglycerol--serine O-phosphatidyltransferase, partial [Marivivens sp.]|nr:CDP-diacylglycerol--serine O-phosphatidyltransferase [Marivivens sp.]